METTNRSSSRSFIEIALILLLLFLMLYAAYGVLSPFFGVFAYAVIFSVSFYGVYGKYKHLAGKYKKIPAMVYGLVLVSIIAVPFVLIISKLVNLLHNFRDQYNQVKAGHVPVLPEAVKNIPVLGEKATSFWSLLEKDPAGTLKLYDEQINAALQHLISSGTGILGSGLELIVGIIISAVLLYHGSSALEPLKNFLIRLLGTERSEAIIDASGKAIKGVAVGVMGTALLEAAAALIGFLIAGVPYASGLAALVFLFAIVQLGPLLVAIPVTIWLGSQGETGWAIFMGIYTLVVLVGIDNILKPILIGKSGKLPILILFLGVVGGLAAWGFTGMFKGAIILSVLYTLLKTWWLTSTDANTDNSGKQAV
jgi:predicted PurR-regulated permease PerM